jgi:hypothetical protein
MKRFLVSMALVSSLAATGCSVTLSGGADVGQELENGTTYLAWHLLSSKKSQREVYEVGAEHGQFSAIYLTTNQPVNVSRVVVTFDNGETMEAEIGGEWGKGHQTAQVALGGARGIQHVDVFGQASTKQLAKVEIYGMR